MATEVKSPMTDSAFRTEQKPGERNSYSEGRAGSSSGDSKSIEQKTSDVIDKVSEKAHSAGETVIHAGKNVVDHIRDGYSTVNTFTKENPTAAVLIAFAAGAILARLLPSR